MSTAPKGQLNQPIGDKVDEEQLRRYAALMDDFRREKRGRKLAIKLPFFRARKVPAAERWESNQIFEDDSPFTPAPDKAHPAASKSGLMDRRSFHPKRRPHFCP